MRQARRAVWFGGAIIGAALAVGACKGAVREKPSADPSTLRTTQAGKVVGFKAQYGSDAWLGIPYAAAPTGDLRWRAPQAPPPWSGTREALSFGSPCPQYASVFGGVPGPKGTVVGNEDCLYLNVWTPRFPGGAVPTGDKRLPVMLWIHGGGNSIGEGGFFNGGHLAVKQDLVVITFNYRLGPLGWFRQASLRDNATDLDRSGNYGTLDLVRALEWVRDNAAAFGGNPNNVTIFGESAGGQNVFSLLLAPQAHGLFQHAIAESGGLWMSDPPEGEHFTDDADPGHENSSSEALARMLVADGSAADRAAAKAAIAAKSDAELASYLRSRSAAQIFAAYPAGPTGMIQMPKVFSEGVVLPPGDPLQHFAQSGDYNQVPVIFGTNRDENKLFMFGDPKRVKRWFGIVPRIRDEQSYNLSAEFLSKNWKATGADGPARAMRASQNPNVFVYRFDWDEEPTLLGADLSEMLGAAHGFEIPFVFGHFDLGKEGNVIFTSDNEPGRFALSDQMMSYWAQFAYTGNPGRGRDGKLPEWTAWPPADANQPSFIVFDTTAGGGVRMSGETVTVDGVLAAVDSDPRFPDQRSRCRVLRELAEWGRGFTKEQYAAKASCAQFPYAGYPWE